jgi:hypothetical protein
LANGDRPDRVLVNPQRRRRRRAGGRAGAARRRWRARLGRAEAPTVGFVGTFGLWHGVRSLPAIDRRGARRARRRALDRVGSGALFDEVRAEIERRGLR